MLNIPSFTFVMSSFSVVEQNNWESSGAVADAVPKLIMVAMPKLKKCVSNGAVPNLHS